ncbi:MAG TPA: MoxR family ATPase [Candidatus Polarisedimenticolaceae bacterium]|nr:MoxR family ATPase [Candidatus Polarisedimenticolaceae bacterium]
MARSADRDDTIARGPTVTLEGVTVHLAHPDELPIKWVGQEDTLRQLLGAWSLADPRDVPMNPRLLGKPGVGKTTLAYAAGKALGKDVYVYQATMDTRPEDLLITPVIDAQGTIRYVASSLVTAMIRGGVAILDEGNRMSEKSWASLAPLLDARRYVESIVAGVKVKAHADFRIVATMNDDASTYEIPEYIHSRLQPQIHLDFPDADEERAILQENLPFSDAAILDYVVRFLQAAHAADERYTVRDGINIARYALKRMAQASVEPPAPKDLLPSKRKKAEEAEGARRAEALKEAVRQVLGEEGERYAP